MYASSFAPPPRRFFRQRPDSSGAIRQRARVAPVRASPSATGEMAHTPVSLFARMMGLARIPKQVGDA